MLKKKYLKFFFLFFLLFLFIWVFFKSKLNYSIENETSLDLDKDVEKIINSSNIIKNVSYSAIDKNGNEYLINAAEGEIDLSNRDIILLKNIKSFIKLTNSNNVTITSKFGKYNIINYDTIFRENVFITYDDIKIYGDYMEFSIINNLMTIKKNVILVSPSNILKADVIDMNIKTKDTKIYMNKENKKIIIKSK